MRIAVSACLLGRTCKYNGGSNRDDALVEALRAHELVEVCPEVTGGLPTPRACSEIREGRVVNTQGVDVTPEFERGARECLAQCEGIDLAILQPRSPSCGVSEIYDGTFSKTRIHGAGIFARMLLERGVRCVEAGDPGLLEMLA